jgi:PPM family protein phosphatase
VTGTDHRTPHLSWGGSTHVGRVREVNQDALHADAGLFAVADGMGGHQGGEVAARLTVQTLAGSARRNVDELVAAVEAANRVVHEASAEQPDLRGMGTTVVSLAVVDTSHAAYAAIASVGDSRVYRWRAGVLEQLTVDHNYVAEMVDRGELSLAAAATHPYRNMLTRAVGVEPRVAVDARVETLVAGDRYVLCSDGLTNEVSDDEIGAVLGRLADPADAARELVRLANEHGGRDNVTALVVDVDDAPRATAPPAATLEQPVIADQPIASVAGAGWVTQFALPALAVVGVLITLGRLLGWYSRNAYYIAYDDDEVTILQGRPGGVLWFSPTVEEHTGIYRDELTPDSAAAVEDRHRTASFGGARQWVSTLQIVDAPPVAAAEGDGTAPSSTSSAPASDSTPPSAGSSSSTGPPASATAPSSTGTPSAP